MLRRRLELLQREYERTAQRLQRAERKEAVRKHVQNRILDQNRLLQINTSGFSQPSLASSADLPSTQALPPETDPDGFPSAKKTPLVRFRLPDWSDSSPCSTPTCKRSPTQRLRSKRSRLRLQSREKESDADSQEKARDGEEERLRGENAQKTVDRETTSMETGVDVARVEEKEKNGAAEGQTEKEKAQNGSKEKDGDEERQRKEGLRKGVVNSDVGSQGSPHPAAETSSGSQPVGGVFPNSQLEVRISPDGQSVEEDSQPSSAASDQSLMQVPAFHSSGLSNQLDGQNKEAVSVADEACEDIAGAPFSPDGSGFLDSCTVIEGLPFPVEYYIRTTRRMAAARSQVDLDAVIHSQLSGGRGRRRSSLSQRQARGRVTSEASQPDDRAPYQPRQRGRGRRGRRGRRRTRPASSPTVPCTGSCSEQNESESPSQSLLQSQSSLPQAKQSVPTPEPASVTQPAAAVFKHLSDSQLYLDCKLLPGSGVYPIFRRRRGQAEAVGSCSHVEESTNDCTPPLSSLASLVQALKVRNCRYLGRLLSTFDVQDFHLPDREFGQLKLERLRTACLNVEPPLPHISAYNTRQRSRSCNFRAHEDKDSSEGRYVVDEQFVAELLPPSCSLEGSVPLSQVSSADGSSRKRNTDEKHPETANPVCSDSAGQNSCITSSEQGVSPGTGDPVQLRNTHQLDESTTYRDRSVAPVDDGSQCPAVLNLSRSQTSHTQQGPESSLPSLGITPHRLTPTSPSLLTVLSSPSDQSIALCSSQLRTCQAASQAESDTPAERALQTPSVPEPAETTEPAKEVWVGPVKRSPPQNPPAQVPAMQKAENGNETETVETQQQDVKQSESELHSISGHEGHPQTAGPPHSQHVDTDGDNGMEPCTTNATSVPSANARADVANVCAADVPDQTSAPSEQATRALAHSSPSADQASNAEMVHQRQPTGAAHQPDRVISCGSLQKTHTIKALEGGCVLDVCLVRWPSEDWGVCVAGEWSVCVWAQKAGVLQWTLLHSWTFTQSVISLQEVPDSPGLLCVCLGRLEITEARILCCPGVEGGFSQAELSKGSLQAVVGVSDCRLATCCSAPGAQQKVTVFTLTQDGRVADAVSLVSTNRSIQALAVVERKKDALIGWTECKTLLIWNMKSGQLLQIIRLAETMSMATCLKGYSYKGALCVLLQRASACDVKSGSALFTLIAINPLTGRYLTLTSITSSAPHIER
ncbi:hypothetical protein NFI96_014893 [Prochilodus magdalenae]|nr:hypothetical protein NFI96_014893 [Prochilodus magdalenae]